MRWRRRRCALSGMAGALCRCLEQQQAQHVKPRGPPPPHIAIYKRRQGLRAHLRQRVHAPARADIPSAVRGGSWPRLSCAVLTHMPTHPASLPHARPPPCLGSAAAAGAATAAAQPGAVPWGLHRRRAPPCHRVWGASPPEDVSPAPGAGNGGRWKGCRRAPSPPSRMRCCLPLDGTLTVVWQHRSVRAMHCMCCRPVPRAQPECERQRT
jgi:hypothetical protein